mgnify:CR=1 FL=1
MQDLLDRYEKHYGYKATVEELYGLYTQGCLPLNSKDENTLLKAVNV